MAASFFIRPPASRYFHFSNHVSPNILLIAPFYLIYSGPETLLVLQTVAVALGGLPLFWLSREKLGSDFAGLTILLAYLLFPTLEIVTLWDYHPPVISVGFFMFAFYFLEKRRPGWFLLFVFLAMMGKEQLPLQVVFLGLYAIIRHKYWGLGLTAIGLALAWFFTIMYWIIPANSVTGEHLFISYYADLGESPLEIVTTTATRPDLVIKNLWQPAKLKYLFDVTTPFAYLPLIGLPILLIGSPSFAINLLSANSAMHDASQAQYGADVAPWLAWATLFGAVYLRHALLRFWPNQQTWLTGAISLILLLFAVAWHLLRGFSPLALDPPYWEITGHDRLAQRFIDQIPPDASLAAQGKLYPHLSNRIIAYQLPDVNAAEYIFVDVTRGTWPIHPNDLWARVQELLASGQYGIQDAADGYLLLRRGLVKPAMPDSFYDFARETEATPQYPMTVDFGDELRLLGFDVIDNPRKTETAVRLYWQALKPIERNLRLYPFFIDDKGHLVEDTEQRPLLTQLWFPPRQWQPGEIIVAETMPWALGNRWSLAVGVLDESNWADWSRRLPTQVINSPTPLRQFEASTWVRLSTFERQGRTLVEIVPSEDDLQPSRVLEANLADQMQLLGYDIPDQITTGDETIPVTLYWQAATTVPLDYTIFVHLIGPDGQLVAQHDDGPWWDVSIPTSTWQPGEKLRDQHILTLPSDLAPGSYHLQAGVYYWQTLERLSILENGSPVNNFVELGSLTVQP